VKTNLDELGSATDRLNESFEHLEGALTALKFGVPASVQLDSTDKLLVFGKTNSGWKLMIESANSSTDLVSTSRETRLRAADKIEELFFALNGERERQLEEVLRAIEKVDALTRKIHAQKNT
jgi:hypothetical protein